MKTGKIQIVVLFLAVQLSVTAQGIIADHTCTDLSQVPIAAIQAAKAQLHIGYGFTSHGSQIIGGMTGLVEFMNNKEGYPENLFTFNRTGSDGALHLYEGDGYDSGDLDHDAGYYPDWVNETRAFLGSANTDGRGSAHPTYNVIMWAWCGQLSWYSSEDVSNYYLNEMTQLESDYPGIIFVYMTGHSDGSGLEGMLHQNNQKIREYCIKNNKALFDFYDIECYDPDGHYYGDQYVSDDCSYANGNWAQAWQNSHTEGQDWYSCDAAHTEPINANQKAYAIWWLWARLAGWDGGAGTTAVETGIQYPSQYQLEQNYPNPFNGTTSIRFALQQSAHVKMRLYNSKGQLVSRVIDQLMAPDSYTVQVQMDQNPTGVYYYQLDAGTFHQTKSMVFTK